MPPSGDEIGSSGVFIQDSDINSGTGNYNSFLRIQNNDNEQGFNTDTNNLENNKDGIWTHSLLISSLQQVEIDGVFYYEIRLDLNETNSKTGPDIALEQLQLYVGDAAVSAADLSNPLVETKVFDLLAANGGNGIDLVDHNSGSGSDDYVFLVPVDTVSAADGDYLTLYADFSGADGGFEEFRVKTNTGIAQLPTIHLEKDVSPTHVDEGSSAAVTYTYEVTNASTDGQPLTLTTFTDDNGTPALPGDDVDLLSGVDGLHPYGAYYTGGDTDGDHKVDTNEMWTFSYTSTSGILNAGDTKVNIATVNGVDPDGNNASDSDDATVTADDVTPAITLVKDASPTSINEGAPTDITYTYTLTSQSPDSDPLTINSLIDDNGTPSVSGDDFDLISGVDASHPLGVNYVSGDLDNDHLLDSNETWIFSYTKEDVTRNAVDGSLVNTAVVTAHDDENNEAQSTDDATVTVNDVDPTINIDKVASVTQIQAGTPTDVTFTYSITNTSPAGTDDPIVLTHLVDDMGTVATGDDIILFDGDSTLGLGPNYVSGDDGDGLLETGETWVFQYTVNDMTLNPGVTRTNIATVTGHDDENNSVSDTDDASITAFNLGRTPGFWANLKNGGKLWDGNDNTWPNGGDLGTTSIAAPGHDLAYKIYDLNGDGVVSGATETAGSRNYLMIGDWNHDGIAEANENVLVITHDQALSLLNSSDKQQQDGRFVLARDLVASWLNFLGSSYVGTSDDPNSAMHFIDEAVAWLIQTTNGDHVLTTAELTAGTKVAQSSSGWQQGYDFGDANTIKGQNEVPAAGQHDLGAGTNLDIMAGSVIHTGLDHYNNFGFV